VFLVDTNCWIDVLIDPATATRSFLGGVPAQRLFVSLFSVHGVGLVLGRHRMLNRFAEFLTEMSIGRGVVVVQIPALDLAGVAEAARRHNLDFDDAYQYAAAERHGLRLVSLDSDFDHTPNGRLTPMQALELFREEQRQTGQQP
jgi:uncharacterized protein